MRLELNGSRRGRTAEAAAEGGCSDATVPPSSETTAATRSAPTACRRRLKVITPATLQTISVTAGTTTPTVTRLTALYGEWTARERRVVDRSRRHREHRRGAVEHEHLHAPWNDRRARDRSPPRSTGRRPRGRSSFSSPRTQNGLNPGEPGRAGAVTRRTPGSSGPGGGVGGARGRGARRRSVTDGGTSSSALDDADGERRVDRDDFGFSTRTTGPCGRRRECSRLLLMWGTTGRRRRGDHRRRDPDRAEDDERLLLVYGNVRAAGHPRRDRRAVHSEPDPAGRLGHGDEHRRGDDSQRRGRSAHALAHDRDRRRRLRAHRRRRGTSRPAASRGLSITTRTALSS